MRLVCVADTHLFERSLPPVPMGDVLVHAGDMLRRGSMAESALSTAASKTGFS